MSDVYALRASQHGFSGGTQVYIADTYDNDDEIQIAVCETRFPPFKQLETPQSNLVKLRKRQGSTNAQR